MSASLRRISTLLAAFGLLALALVGVQAATTQDAHAAGIQATVCYNTSQAGQFAGTADQAASIWTSRTNNVNMSKCGSNLMIYYTYGGGSYAVRYSLGNGYVVIDVYQAQQYSPLRIMSHEMGHILGLPDNYNGNCAILMSGGSAGTGCTNPYPSSAEAARVDQLFGGLTTADVGPRVFSDSWPTKNAA
ncbi:MAG: snapalysin family zinc-dependent metalloprotease [Micromonosporaceae bacterium]